MAGFDQKFNFPSGVQLPFILRKKAEEQRAQAVRGDASATTDDSTTFPMTFAAQSQSTEPGRANDLRNRTFTSEELDNKIWKATVALVEIQKQIHRGEDAYYEETFGHGNLFRGWEGFLDAKDVGATSNSKPPKDTRWFSGSSSISRAARPPPISTQWSTTAHLPSRPFPVPRSTSSVNVPLAPADAASASTVSAGPMTESSTNATIETTSLPPPSADTEASTTTKAAPPPKTIPAPASAPAANPSAPPKKPEADAKAVSSSSDSFRIPKKKKKGDSSPSPVPTDTIAAPSPNPPTNPKQTGNDQSTDKKNKAGRKRKGFD